jgi:hypothetical protein
MKKTIVCAAVFAAMGVALAACVTQQQAAGPAPDYQAPLFAASAPPPGVACYNDDEIRIVGVRMAQQVMTTGVLICKNADGSRIHQQEYTTFINKFQDELKGNYAELSDLVKRRRLNMDVIVTEMANRAAGQAQEPLFCNRLQRAFAWSLSPKVSSLNQVPSPYDFTAQMSMHRCTPAKA